MTVAIKKLTILDSYSVSRSTLLLGGLLILFQIVDGFFTSIGISRYGTEAEANPMLRSLMEQIGHIPALSIIKIAAIVLIVALAFASRRVAWVNRAMGAMSCVYFFAAIVPWMYVLFVDSL